MCRVLKLVRMSYINLVDVKWSIILQFLICTPLIVIIPTMIPMVLIISIYTITMTTMFNEDNSEIDTLISYLPVKKTDYIFSSYLLIFFNTLIGVILYTAYFYIIYLMRKYIGDLSIITDGINSYSYIILLTVGIFMSIFIISITIPGKLMFKRISKIFDGLAGFLLASMMVILINIESGGVFSKIYSMSNFNVVLITIISCLIITFISYILSINIYKNKEVQ